jgi:hypothetical protein
MGAKLCSIEKDAQEFSRCFDVRFEWVWFGFGSEIDFQCFDDFCCCLHVRFLVSGFVALEVILEEFGFCDKVSIFSFCLI